MYKHKKNAKTGIKCVTRNKQLNLSRPLFTAQNLDHQSYHFRVSHTHGFFDSVWQFFGSGGAGVRAFRRFLHVLALLRCHHCSISLLLLKDLKHKKWLHYRFLTFALHVYTPLYIMETEKEFRSFASQVFPAWLRACQRHDNWANMANNWL